MMKKYAWLFILILFPLFSGCGDVPDTISSISIAPTSSNLVVGATQQFTASGTDSQGYPVSFTPAWSVSNPTVGSITSGGLFTASTIGTTSAIVSADDMTASALVTISTGGLYSITVTPSPVTMSTSEPQAFIAYGYNLYGGAVSITPSWAVVGAMGTIETDSGFFYPSAAGSGFVTATSNEVTGTASVSVTTN
ncbi:Ig-like domain-containing protein [Candidatus Margulisiibacteriota bacterium]